MRRKERHSLSLAWARWTTRYPRCVLLVVLFPTCVFAYGLTRIEFSTRILDFHRQESKELISTIETGFNEGSYLTLIFASKDEQKSLLEPTMLHQQFRVLEEIKARFPVETFSLVDAIDQGLRRIKKVSLLEVSDYTTIAEGILGLAGGRSVRDLEKVSRNILSHPEAIGFYTRLRLARDVMPSVGPMQRGAGRGGVEKTEFFVPTLQAMKAFIQLKGSQSPQEKRRIATQVRDLARSFVNEELTIYVTSDDLIAAEIDERTARNIIVMALIVVLVACFLFWIIFMRAQEVLIALILMGTSLIWTFGLAGFLGFRLAFIHLLVVPILLGTGNDDAFVFGRQLLQERQDSPDLLSAIENTFRKIGKAIFMTTFTTFIAFGVGAWIAESEGIRTFNILVALSMLIVFLLTVLLQGPLRVWMSEEEGVSPLKEASLKRKLHEIFLRFSLAMGTFSFRYASHNRRRVLLVSFLVGLAGLGLSFGLQKEFSRRIFLRPNMQTAHAYHANEKYFGLADHGYLLLEGEVENPLVVQQLKKLEKVLFQYPLIQKILGQIYVDSITELIDKLFIGLSPQTNMRAVFDRISENPKTANFALNQSFQEAAEHRVRKHNDRYDGLLVKFFVTGGEGEKIRTLIDDVNHEMETLGFDKYQDLNIRIGGGDVSYYLEEGYFFTDFITGVFLSFGLNFLVLLLLWRRVALAALALLPLVLSLLLTLGTMVLFGVELNVLNLCIGAIIVGVGIDYPIHIIERYTEEKKVGSRSSLEALQRALQSIGPSVWAGALTTIVGFSACTILAMPVAVSFGLLMAWAILCVYLASIFFLPALLVRSRKWNSWQRPAETIPSSTAR